MRRKINNIIFFSKYIKLSVINISKKSIIKKKQKYPNHKLDRVLGGKIVSFFKWLWVFLAGPLGN